MEGPIDIHRLNDAPVAVGHFLQRAGDPAAHAAGGVDRDIDCADPGDERIDSSGLGDIEAMGLDRETGRGGGLPDQLAFDVHDVNLRPFGGEGVGNGAADAACRAGHEDTLAGKRNLHTISSVQP